MGVRAIAPVVAGKYSFAPAVPRWTNRAGLRRGVIASNGDQEEPYSNFPLEERER